MKGTSVLSSDASQNATVCTERGQQAEDRGDQICGPYPASALFPRSVHEPPHTSLNIGSHKPKDGKREYNGITSAFSTLGNEYDTGDRSQDRPKKRRSQVEIPMNKGGGQGAPREDVMVAKPQSGSVYNIKPDTKASMRVQSASAQTQAVDQGGCGSNQRIQGDKA